MSQKRCCFFRVLPSRSSSLAVPGLSVGGFAVFPFFIMSAIYA